jgi:hypothetical protein
MLKRTSILALLAVVFALSIFLAGASADKQMTTQSKADHARRLWSGSPHADKADEPFTHWDEDGSIPTSCAKCHSTPGFKDYIGADGSAANVVDEEAALGTTVECEACHADPERGIVHDHTSVVFPSKAVISGLGPEALCMECHQGRASTPSVNAKIDAAALTDDDTPSSELSFTNIHYFAAAATQFGTVVKGGYEYAGKSYDARFSHITGYNACIVCHNSHSLEVDLEACQTCHTGVKDPKNIRYLGSLEDYDGDGNVTEGIYYEVDALRGYLYSALLRYAREVIGKPIVYDADSNPYFFNDKNDNGVADADETESANAYKSFSARLLRAAYNYQVSVKDPCGYVHNGKYIIELLYDSLEDLNAALGVETAAEAAREPQPVQSFAASRPEPVDRGRDVWRPGEQALSGDLDAGQNDRSLRQSASQAHGSLRRTDEGHFDGSSMAFRDWDADGEVPTTCAKCHSAEGLPTLLENGSIDEAKPIANGFLCTTCHTSPPHTRPAGAVRFPSGEFKDLGDSSNLCLNCHQGRASKKTVDGSIASGPGPYRFTNIHYFAAAASYFGHEVLGGYEFAGKTYAGRNPYSSHLGLFTTCVECHFGTKSPNRKLDDSDDQFHLAAPSKADCSACHGNDISQPFPGDASRFEFSGIRPAHIPDYDADGNTSESLQAEIDALEDALLAQLQAYADSIGMPIGYDENAYPYFFNDLNRNGVVDADEANSGNGYPFDAVTLRTGYNLQFSKKEPCGYIHNALYFAQLLVDSIGHLGGQVSKYSWR